MWETRRSFSVLLMHFTRGSRKEMLIFCFLCVEIYIRWISISNPFLLSTFRSSYNYKIHKSFVFILPSYVHISLFIPSPYSYKICLCDGLTYFKSVSFPTNFQYFAFPPGQDWNICFIFMYLCLYVYIYECTYTNMNVWKFKLNVTSL